MQCFCESSLCDHEGACARPADDRLTMDYVGATCTQCAANMAASGGGCYINLGGSGEPAVIGTVRLDRKSVV